MNTETHALIPLENPQPSVLFVPGGLESILSRIESDARAMVPDISTSKGRAAIASLAMKVAKAKTYLDGLGKDFTAELKRQTSSVDAERKAMRDRLDSLKAEVRRPLDEWEQIETNRVAAIRQRISALNVSAPDGMPSDYYARSLGGMAFVLIDDSFAEFKEDAQQVMDAALYRLTRQRSAAEEREAQAAKVAAEAEAARIKAQQEREERISSEAAEKATREAEEKARQEQIRMAQAQAKAIAAEEEKRKAAEQARADTERRAREAAEKAAHDVAQAKAREAAAAQQERDRAAAEARAKQAADAKRAADNAHRAKVHAEIVEDMQDARKAVDDVRGIVEAIASGQVRHLKITY